mgnify:CR=1 FL=1
MELISKYTASSEFADLHEEVQKAYEQAVGSDANLKTMLETTLTGAKAVVHIVRHCQFKEV